MKISTYILLFAAIIFGQTIGAQSSTNYVIQLGNSNVSVEAHTALSDIANLYFQPSEKIEGQKLTLGSFSDLQKYLWFNLQILIAMIRLIGIDIN